MKKLFGIFLILALAVFMTACRVDGSLEASIPTSTAIPATTAPTKLPLEGSLEEIIKDIYAQQPVEFDVVTVRVDITDTEWSLISYTGLSSNEQITEAFASEAMIGAIPYSLVLVRVKDAADAEAVAQQMKEGIDPRKWICVEANDLKVAGYCDVVMLVMVSSDYAEDGISAQAMVDAFQAVCGSTLDFTIS